MRKVASFISSFFMIALLAGAGAGCSPSGSKERHMLRANRYFEAGEYDKAEVEYLNVLRYDAADSRAFSRLGIIYTEQGRYSRAVPNLLKAEELDPNDMDVRLKLGLIYLSAGKLKEARDEVSFVLERLPQNDEAPLLLAELAFTSNTIQETRQRLETLSQTMGERASLQVALGTLDFRQRNLDGAKRAFERAQALDPKLSAVYSALGSLYRTQNDLKRAEEFFKTAAALAPLRSPRRLGYASFKIQTGDLAAGKRILEGIIRETPDFLPAWKGLAEIALAEKNYDECAALVSKILVRDPGNYDALLLSGRLQLGRGETNQATAEFEKLAKAYPQAPVAHYQLALAYLANNEPTKAIDRLNQTLKFDPEFSEAALLLAGLRIKTGDLSSAIVSLKKMVHEQPQNARAQLLLAAAYRAQGNLDDALAVYRRLTETFPQSPEAPLLMGSVLLEEGKRDDARQAFEKTLELSPDSLPALEQLVNMDLAENQFTTALRRVEPQIEKNPKLAASHLLLAKIYLAKKDTKQAEAALRRAIELQPNSRMAYMMLASLYIDTGQHEKALENLRGVVNRNPKDDGALMLIGIIHDQQKDYNSARDTYERLLAVDPKFTPALNNLAWLYSEHFGQLDKAYEMASRAQGLLPNDPLTMDTLGWILYRKGQYPSALALLRESADKLPAEPKVQFHLAMTDYMMGNEDAARTAFQRSIQLNNEFADKQEADRRLAVLSIDATAAGADVRAELEKQVAEHPNDPIALARLATIYGRQEETNKAIEAYQASLKASPNNVRALIGLAQLYSDGLGDTQRALELAKAAYKLAPDDPGVTYTLGQLAYRTGDYKWAVSLLQQTAREEAEAPDVLYDFALASYSVGRVADAETAMNQVLETGATSHKADDARRFLDMVTDSADPLRAQADVSKAEEILKSDPSYVPALMVIATANEQSTSGGTSVARSAYERILSRYPDFSPAKRRLAILYSLDPHNNQKAYELGSQAREAFPDDPEVAKALGIIVYRRGDYARAANLLKESAAKLNTDGSVLYYLGMAQYKLKQPVDYRATLERALALNLPNELAAEATRTLTEQR